jgi:hypothetical protein
VTKVTAITRCYNRLVCVADLAVFQQFRDTSVEQALQLLEISSTSFRFRWSRISSVRSSVVLLACSYNTPEIG